MFSRLAAFRSKRPAAQSGKKHDNGGFSLDALSMGEETSGKEALKFSSKSMPASKSVTGAPFARSTFLKFDALNGISPFFDRNSSCPDEFDEIIAISSGILSYEDAEEQFLEEHESYFLHLRVDNMRKDQYPMLAKHKFIYLDHAASPLYSRFQVERHMKYLLEEHKPSGSNYAIDKNGAAMNTYISSTYHHILNILKTNEEDYSVIFTPGFASCYRLFADMHQLQNGSLVLISPDHHSSAQHILQAAVLLNIKIGVLPMEEKDLSIYGSEMHGLLRQKGWSSKGTGLLIYSMQSFHTGICHSMSWVTVAQQNGWKVLLDVSSSLPLVSVDLSIYQPEFVVGSLHHILGYPSGVCFLLVRRSSHSICTKKGSRELLFVDHPEEGKPIHVVTEGEELSTHTFAAMNFGFQHLESIGTAAIQGRVESLIAWLIKNLKSLKHKLFDKFLIQIYGSLDQKHRGSILVFNVLDSTGSILPARAVQQFAERCSIFLGCCCLVDEKIASFLHLNSHRQKGRSHLDASLCNLYALRLSLGVVSTFGDAYRLVQFLSRFRDEKYMSHVAAQYAEEIENE